MSTEQTEAIVIRMADFSESSRVVTFFSRDFGKISAIAKGAKRAKSAFEAAIDLLSVCNIVFIRKASGGLDILTEAQLKTRFKSNDRDLTSLYGGYYVAELLAGLSEEYDVHRELYFAARDTLDALSDGENFATAITRFELSLLREIGLLPTFDVCVRCGQPAAEAAWYGVKILLGGFVCRACLEHEQYYHRLAAGTVAAINKLASTSDPSWQRLTLTPKQMTEIRGVLDSAIRHALGRKPKTLSFLKFK